MEYGSRPDAKGVREIGHTARTVPLGNKEIAVKIRGNSHYRN